MGSVVYDGGECQGWGECQGGGEWQGWGERR